MSEKNSAQNIIQSYRKRQQMGPFLIGGLAVVLAIVGIIILVVWFTGQGQAGGLSLFASKTPTPTSTNTPTPVTPTATVTMTPTITVTPEPSATLTRTGPMQYIVQEGDTCWDLASKFGVDINVLLAINNFEAGTCPINPKDLIWIPTEDQQLDTPTPVPADFQGEIEYTIQIGDSLTSIAEKFLSTVDSIKKRNNITDETAIKAGEKIWVRVNIATRVPTKAPTSTIDPNRLITAPPSQATATMTVTPATTVTANP